MNEDNKKYLRELAKTVKGKVLIVTLDNNGEIINNYWCYDDFGSIAQEVESVRKTTKDNHQVLIFDNNGAMWEMN